MVEVFTGWCPPGFPARCSGLATRPRLPTPVGSRAYRPCPQALQEGSPLHWLLPAPLIGPSQLLEGKACVSLGASLAHRREDGGRQAPAVSPFCAPRSLWVCVHPWPSWTRCGRGWPEARLIEEAELQRGGEPSGLLPARGALWSPRDTGQGIWSTCELWAPLCSEQRPGPLPQQRT